MTCGLVDGIVESHSNWRVAWIADTIVLWLLYPYIFNFAMPNVLLIFIIVMIYVLIGAIIIIRRR